MGVQAKGAQPGQMVAGEQVGSYEKHIFLEKMMFRLSLT